MRNRNHMMPVPLDFSEIHKILLIASRTAFLAVRHAHPEEHFYAFSLFHEPLWNYIDPASNSEEGLIRRAEEYQQDRWNLGYASQTISELATMLRWSPGDWAYLNTNDNSFEPVRNWLRVYDVYDRIGDANDEDGDRMDRQMIAACRSVLLELDNEGLFGRGEERENVTLNIMMGDQDRSWIEHARVLNPSGVYERWLGEIGEGGRL